MMRYVYQSVIIQFTMERYLRQGKPSDYWCHDRPIQV